MFKKSAGFFCAAALLFATAGYAQTDAALTSSVTTKLAADATVKAGTVKVSTDGQVVTLSGTVPSAAAKARALSIARETAGVTSVVDKLSVSASGPTVADKAAGGVAKGADKSADAVGTAADKTAGAVDKSKSAVGKAAEKTGDALGTAAKATGNAVGTAAKKTAEAVGVGADKTKEATEKAADKTRSGTATAADKTKAATEKAGDKTRDTLSGAGDRAAGSAGDAAITAAVKTKLLGDGKTPGLALDVDTSNGVVTISGEVPTAAAHTEALRLARTTKGVTRVVDKMKVAGK